MQLTYTVWVESRHNTREGGRRENTGYTSYQEHESVSVHDLLSTGRHLLGVSFIYNKPKVKFMHSPNHTTLQKINVLRHTHKKHDCTFAQCILNWNISYTGHKQGRVGFPQRKPFPRSTTHSTVSSTNLDPVIETWAHSGLPEPLQRNAEEDLQVDNRCKLDLDMNGLLLKTI